VTTIPASKPSLAGLSKAELAEKLIAAGVEPKKAKMRAEQLWRWIYHYGVTDFSAMTNVAKELRATLAEHYTLDRPEIVTQQISTDGTRKWLIRLGPGTEAEAVFIPGVGKAGALCVSSQVGCTLNCTFCHTGTQKLVRNLSHAEIVAQVMIARDALGEWPTLTRPLNDGDRQMTNIVFMGMGEPLYNLDNVDTAIDIISDGDGISIGRRRITVSTPVSPDQVGDRTGAMLAISLHAPMMTAQRAGAAQQEVQSRTALRRDPHLSLARQRQARDIRIRDAEGHQRYDPRSQSSGETARQHSSEDQPYPVQPLAGQPV
jgi:23S rRNA (adenine2503-C2)-methyltransferase